MRKLTPEALRRDSDTKWIGWLGSQNSEPHTETAPNPQGFSPLVIQRRDYADLELCTAEPRCRPAAALTGATVVCALITAVIRGRVAGWIKHMWTRVIDDMYSHMEVFTPQRDYKFGREISPYVSGVNGRQESRDDADTHCWERSPHVSMFWFIPFSTLTQEGAKIPNPLQQHEWPDYLSW